jgi:hypothetical protein
MTSIVPECIPGGVQHVCRRACVCPDSYGVPKLGELWEKRMNGR